MTCSAPVPADHPLMTAWNAYKASEGYANTLRWAKEPAHTEGSLWAAFSAGFDALSRPQPVAETVEAGWIEADQIIRDMVKAEDELIAELQVNGQHADALKLEFPIMHRMRSYCARVAALRPSAHGEAG